MVRDEATCVDVLQILQRETNDCSLVLQRSLYLSWVTIDSQNTFLGQPSFSQ